MTCTCTVKIIGPPERVEFWHNLWRGDAVPITSPHAKPVTLGDRPSIAYFVDLTRATPNQLDEIANRLVSRFGGAFEEAATQMVQIGLPIEAKDLSLELCPEHRTLGP